MTLVEPAHGVLQCDGLCRSVGGREILSNLSFTIGSGEILFIRGPSGVGKSLLLRNLAYLDPISSGSLTVSAGSLVERLCCCRGGGWGQPQRPLAGAGKRRLPLPRLVARPLASPTTAAAPLPSVQLNDKTPSEWGVPKWRALVNYVHQSRVPRAGTPAELHFAAQQFVAQRGRPRGDLPAIIAELGLDQGVLNQPWTQLSVRGGAQRAPRPAMQLAPPCVLLLKGGQLPGRQGGGRGARASQRHALSFPALGSTVWRGCGRKP